jgi:hypothetical protein
MSVEATGVKGREFLMNFGENLRGMIARYGIDCGCNYYMLGVVMMGVVGGRDSWEFWGLTKGSKYDIILFVVL